MMPLEAATLEDRYVRGGRNDERAAPELAGSETAGCQLTAANRRTDPAALSLKKELSIGPARVSAQRDHQGYTGSPRQQATMPASKLGATKCLLAAAAATTTAGDNDLDRSLLPSRLPTTSLLAPAPSKRHRKIALPPANLAGLLLPLSLASVVLSRALLLTTHGSGGGGGPLLAEALIQTPNRHTAASIPGDLVIGILIPVHERPTPEQAQTRTCGAVREQYGIQRVEAAFRIIDSINADPTILPNITLGIEIRDSCWHSPIALEQSIEFVRDAMAASEQTQNKLTTLGGFGAAAGGNPPTDLLSSAGSGSSSANSICAPILQHHMQQQQAQAKKVKNIVGVVGPASSTDTVQVQNLLQLFNMPQVGYSATSRDLSSKNFFKYFLRVVPSDDLQAKVIIALMKTYNWTYVTVVYTEGNYGSSLMNAFREEAAKAGICSATTESIAPGADDSKYDELIRAIEDHSSARVVICMCEGRTVGRLFNGFKRRNITQKYLVVGSDGWSDRFDILDSLEEALGGISIRIHSAKVHDFDDYYFALSPFTNHRNPWFAEFWEQHFRCNLELNSAAPTASAGGSGSNKPSPAGAGASPGSAQRRPPFIRPPGAKVYNTTCTGRESLKIGYKQDSKMAFVQKSIITMALGLDSMQRAICPPNKPGLCPEMLPVNGSTLLAHLMNVSFSFLNEHVCFDEMGDPPGKYEILNFRRKRPPEDEPATERESGPAEFEAGAADDDDADDGHDDDEIDNNSSGGDDASLSALIGGSTSSAPIDASSHFATGGGRAKVWDAALSPADDSIEDEPARNKIGQSPAALAEKPKPGNNDSYSTLRVFRADSARDQPNCKGSNGGGKQVKEYNVYRNSPSRRRRQKLGDRRYRRLFRSKASKRPRSLHNQQQQKKQESDKSDYEYVRVGSWSSSNNLSMIGEIHWPSNSLVGQRSSADNSSLSSYSSLPSPPLRAPISVCSLPCKIGHQKKLQSDSNKCCWICVACAPNEYLANEFNCTACARGFRPNSTLTGCARIKVVYFDWRRLEGLAAISIALFGLILTLITAIVFIRHNDTPVVKSSTRELSYMILFAMFLCYANTFFLVAEPSKKTCFVTRILPGFAFAMMYGALVTKTNRIARILAGSKKKIITRRPRFMSATSQVVITWIIVLVECLIIVFMLVREPAGTSTEYKTEYKNVHATLVCNTTTMGIIVPLGFDFFLIAMCTLYAFKTRNVPENFNEAKFIGFTMYTTIVIWIAFVVIYLSSEHKVTTLCLCISFSALFALFLLFFPRCYIIIFKPAKNNRSFFTTTKNVRCHIGYQIGSAAHNGSLNTPNATAANLATASSSLEVEHYESPLGRLASDTPSRAASGFQWRELRASQQCNSGSAQLGGLPQNDQLASALAAGGRIDSVCGALDHQQDKQQRAESRRDSAEARRSPYRSAPAFLQALCQGLVALFSRRSRRKESDKVSSIQQHLRAIRHAENLDRQTHFRRSQVQRLAQRFDSQVDNWPPARLAGRPLCQTAYSADNSFRSLEIVVSTKTEDGERLLAALAQLIGARNLWRLADVLRRYCQARTLRNGLQSSSGCRPPHLALAAQSPQPASAGSPRLARVAAAKTTVTAASGTAREPLDLDRAVDRKLALAWLRFLCEVARKSSEELRRRSQVVGSASLDQLDVAELSVCAELDLGALEQSPVKQQEIQQQRQGAITKQSLASLGGHFLCKSAPPSTRPAIAVSGNDNIVAEQQQDDELATMMTKSTAAREPLGLSEAPSFRQQHQQQRRAPLVRQASGDKAPENESCAAVGNNNLSSSNQVAVVTGAELKSGAQVSQQWRRNIELSLRGQLTGNAAHKLGAQGNPVPQGAAAANLAAEIGASELGSDKLDDDYEQDAAQEDPIKRALECIMGTGSAASLPAATRQQQKPAAVAASAARAAHVGLQVTQQRQQQQSDVPAKLGLAANDQGESATTTTKRTLELTWTANKARPRKSHRGHHHRHAHHQQQQRRPNEPEHSDTVGASTASAESSQVSQQQHGHQGQHRQSVFGCHFVGSSSSSSAAAALNTTSLANSCCGPNVAGGACCCCCHYSAAACGKQISGASSPRIAPSSPPAESGNNNQKAAGMANFIKAAATVGASTESTGLHLDGGQVSKVGAANIDQDMNDNDRRQAKTMTSLLPAPNREACKGAGSGLLAKPRGPQLAADDERRSADRFGCQSISCNVSSSLPEVGAPRAGKGANNGQATAARLQSKTADSNTEPTATASAATRELQARANESPVMSSTSISSRVSDSSRIGAITGAVTDRAGKSTAHEQQPPQELAGREVQVSRIGQIATATAALHGGNHHHRHHVHRSCDRSSSFSQHQLASSGRANLTCFCEQPVCSNNYTAVDCQQQQCRRSAKTLQLDIGPINTTKAPMEMMACCYRKPSGWCCSQGDLQNSTAHRRCRSHRRHRSSTGCRRRSRSGTRDSARPRTTEGRGETSSNQNKSATAHTSPCWFSPKTRAGCADCHQEEPRSRSASRQQSSEAESEKML